MKKSILAVTLACLTSVSSARTVVGEIEPNSVFSDGLNASYKVTFELPEDFKVASGFGYEVEKSFFETMSLDLYTQVPDVIFRNDVTKRVTDSTAERDVNLLFPVEKGAYFDVYRRLSSKPLIILHCDGFAETRSTFNAMVKICRSVKLK